MSAMLREAGLLKKLAAAEKRIQELETTVAEYDRRIVAVGAVAINSVSREYHDAEVGAMVDRFLSWRLPDDFMPDCGISFTPLNHPNCWPIGTSLLSATQAKAMFEHCLNAAAPAPKENTSHD